MQRFISRKNRESMVSFIILNYNTGQLVMDCIQSIRQHVKGCDYELIVVDNCSKKEEADFLQQHLDDSVRLVTARWNGGFGMGNMLGANAAKGDYLCFLNSDIVLIEDCVSPLVAYLEAHDDVACITPQQLNKERARIMSFFHPSGIRHELLGDGIMEKLCPASFPDRRKQYDSPQAVFQINGCFFLFPAEKFWAIGGFDPAVFLYTEEYDVGMRVKLHGWKCVYHPNYQFIHLGASSTKKMKGMTQRERYVSKLYTYRKYHGLLLSWIYQLCLLCQLLFKPGKWYILPAVMRGEAVSTSMRHNRYIKEI